MLKKVWDWILYLCAFGLVLFLFKLGINVMDSFHPFIMLLGFIMCSSAVLTCVALIVEVWGLIVAYFMKKH
jgi:hypothetical protein